MNKEKNTEFKNVMSKKQLKENVTNAGYAVLEEKEKVRSGNGLEGTYRKIQLPSGTIKEIR